MTKVQIRRSKSPGSKFPGVYTARKLVLLVQITGKRMLYRRTCNTIRSDMGSETLGARFELPSAVLATLQVKLATSLVKPS